VNYAQKPGQELVKAWKSLGFVSGMNGALGIFQAREPGLIGPWARAEHGDVTSMGERPMRLKIMTLGLSLLACVVLAGAVAPQGPREEGKVGKKKKDEFKKKGVGAPEGDLRKAYDILRKIRSENQAAGRPEARIRDWTERATGFYRQGVRSFEGGDLRAAHEYGAMAHELARAVDHARNATLFDRPDDELPSPPEGFRGDRRFDVERDLREAYDRLGEVDWQVVSPEDTRFYRDAAEDLYRAAVRDAGAGRLERAGELAKSAVAMTHVIDHMVHLAELPVRPRDEFKRGEGPGLPERGRERRGLPPPRID